MYRVQAYLIREVFSERNTKGQLTKYLLYSYCVDLFSFSCKINTNNNKVFNFRYQTGLFINLYI